MPVRSITIKVQITLAFKIVVWRGICVRPGHHNEGKHGDIILSPKMRGAARIALRCHPIAQMGQPRTSARLWEVEAESARLADIFSLLLMPLPSIPILDVRPQTGYDLTYECADITRNTMARSIDQPTKVHNSDVTCYPLRTRKYRGKPNDIVLWDR